jgi:metal-responsive CopG/Arc/MetJ family transcriptional regulator
MKTAVKLEKSLCRRAEQAAAKAGYSSREEFIEHAIERQLAHYEGDSKESTDAVLRKLKGLGYIE